MSPTTQAVLFSVALAIAPCGAHASTSTLSDAEWQRVLAGEYVVHPREEQRADLSLIGGTAWLRIHAPAEDVWQVITQPELYRSLLPYAIEATPDGQDVLVRHKVIFGEVTYRLRFQPNSTTHVLKFWVPEAWGALRAGWGELRVQALSADSCVVTWSVMADPDVGFLGSVFEGAVQRSVLSVPKLIQRFMATHVARPVMNVAAVD
jgi:Polyketide cyclase / dehydrase and lipid transport